MTAVLFTHDSLSVGINVDVFTNDDYLDIIGAVCIWLHIAQRNLGNTAACRKFKQLENIMCVIRIDHITSSLWIIGILYTEHQCPGTLFIQIIDVGGILKVFYFCIGDCKVITASL